MAEDAPEVSLPVSTLLTWIGRIEHGEMVRLLTGCELDDGEGDELSPIEGGDLAAGTPMPNAAGQT